MPAVVRTADTGNQDRSTETETVPKRNRVCRPTPTGFQDSPKLTAARREGHRCEAQQTGQREETGRPRPTRTPRHLNPTSLSQLEPRTHCRYLGKESLPRPRSRQKARQENHFLFSADKEAEAGQSLTRVTGTHTGPAGHAAQLDAQREGAGGRSLTTACKRSTGAALPGGA